MAVAYVKPDTGFVRHDQPVPTALADMNGDFIIRKPRVWLACRPVVSSVWHYFYGVHRG